MKFIEFKKEYQDINYMYSNNIYLEEDSTNPEIFNRDFEQYFLKVITDNPLEYQAVLVDSATNAIQAISALNLYMNKNINYTIPNRTYISVPQAIENGNPNADIKFIDKSWSSFYQCGNFIDSAGYVPYKNKYKKQDRNVDYINIGNKFNKITLEEMFSQNEDIEFIVFSLGENLKKPFKEFEFGRGGVIVFRSTKLETIGYYNFLKRYTHNGRNSAVKVVDDNGLLNYKEESIITILGLEILYDEKHHHPGIRANVIPQHTEKILKELNKRINVKKYIDSNYLWHSQFNEKINEKINEIILENDIIILENEETTYEFVNSKDYPRLTRIYKKYKDKLI